jgi:hypothetical protein
MTFEYTSFDVAGQADMKLVVYTPLDKDHSVEKLDALLDGAATIKRRRTMNGQACRE